MFEQKLECPVCHSKIPFDTNQLLAGAQFVCPECGLKIGLPDESKHIVHTAMKKFEELKKISSNSSK